MKAKKLISSENQEEQLSTEELFYNLHYNVDGTIDVNNAHLLSSKQLDKKTFPRMLFRRVLDELWQDMHKGIIDARLLIDISEDMRVVLYGSPREG